jgi:hypothetical protein
MNFVLRNHLGMGFPPIHSVLRRVYGAPSATEWQGLPASEYEQPSPRITPSGRAALSNLAKILDFTFEQLHYELPASGFVFVDG